jgi:hypothetical protein
MWTQWILKVSTRSKTALTMWMGTSSGTPFPVVHDQPICLADVEGKVVVLAQHCQVTDLLPIGRLIVVCDKAYLSSANLMMVLEPCAATQLWLNREYRRGLSTDP